MNRFIILLFRLLALSHKHFWELTAEVEFWPVLGEPFGGFWLMEWNEIDLIRQSRSFHIRGNWSLSDTPIVRERRETVDFAPMRITTKELQGCPLVLQKNSKKPFLPTWHQLPVVIIFITQMRHIKRFYSKRNVTNVVVISLHCRVGSISDLRLLCSISLYF